MLMESRQQAGAEAATGDESKMRGEARVEAAPSYPIVLRSYEPAADLDERLRRIFTVLSLPPMQERTRPWTSPQALRARGPPAARPSLSWGWALGTGSRFLRETQGSWREGCVWQTKRRSCGKNADGKEGVDGSSPSEGFEFSPA
jgi:hypothetical protein